MGLLTPGLTPPVFNPLSRAAALAPAQSSVPRCIPISPVLTEPGHAWVADGFGTSNLNLTTDFALGTQSVQLTTNNGGSNASPARISNTTAISWDATGRQIMLWLKVDDETKLQSLALYVGSGTSWSNYFLWNFQAIGAPDYTQWFVRSGEWTIITLNFADASIAGTPDRTAITRIRLVGADLATGVVNIGFNGAAMCAEPAAAFPNGVVSITFDDSYAGHQTIGRPRMDLYGFPGTTYTIAELVGTTGYCTIPQLQALEHTSGWEVAAHAFTAAAHNNRFSSLSNEALAYELEGLKKWMLQYGFRGADHLAWPGGDFNAATRSVVSRYFTSARTTIRTTRETAPPPDRLKMRAYNVLNTTTPATVNALVDNAYANRTWLILIFHKLLPSGAATGIEYNQVDFNTVVDYLNTKGIPVRTVSEVLAAL